MDSGEVRQLLTIAAKKDAAVIHVYFGTEAARALPYLKRETRPKVVSFHGLDVSDSLPQEHLNSLIACTDLFLARSHTLAHELQQRGCSIERIRISRTSVPLPAWSGAKQHAPGQTIRILQACRFIHKKGLDITLAAVGKLVQAGHDVTLDLAGDGPAIDALKQQVDALGLAARTHFLGFLPNEVLLGKLDTYTLFAHPSRDTASGDREGIPNSMLEAMAHGLPVVATAHSGIPEAVENGKEGYLVEQNNADALAQAILDACQPERYSAMSAASRARIENEFSSDSAIRSLELAYGEAIQIGRQRLKISDKR